MNGVEEALDGYIRWFNDWSLDTAVGRAGGEEAAALQDARKIKRALATNERNFIEMHCYNITERDMISSHLTSKERERVKFYWLKFPL
jgi:hypothetical protein